MNILEGGSLTVTADASPESFSLEVGAGDFLCWRGWQEGIDVVLRLYSEPGEQLLHEVDSTYETLGPEDLVAVIDSPGVVRFEVEPAMDAPPGDSGEVRFEPLIRRPATAEDRRWVGADRAFREGWKPTDPESNPGELLRLALADFQALEFPRQQAEAHEELARHHRREQEIDLAIVHAERAAELFGQVETVLAWRRGLALLRAGVFQLRQGRATQSARALEQALPLLAEGPSAARLEAEARSHLGTARRRLGDPQAALFHLGRSLDLIGPQPSRVRARAMHNQATTLLMLDRPEAAVESYRTAAETYLALDLEEFATAAREGLANALARAGQLDEALEVAHDAERQIDPDRTTRTRAKVLLTLGRIQRLQGDLMAAASSAENAAALAEKLEDLQIRATARLEQGYIVLLDDDPRASLDHLEGAIDDFGNAEDLAGLAAARLRSAESLIQLGEADRALARIDAALETVETIRRTAAQRQHRLAYFAFRQEYFDLAIGLLVDLATGDDDEARRLEALDLHERRRARELLEAHHQRRRATAAPSVKATKLEIRLANLVTDPSFEKDESARLEAQSLLADLDREWAREDTADLSATVTPITAAYFRDAFLDGETLLLVYAQVGDGVILWCLSAGVPATVHRLESFPELAATIEEFRTALHGDLMDPAEARQNLGLQLTRALLTPVAEHLSRKRLVLVLDGPLEILPFAALPLPGDPSRFLVEEHEIVVLPSLSALTITAPAPNTAPTRTLAAFGDPVFELEDSRVGLSAADPRSDSGAGAGDLESGTLGKIGRRNGVDYFRRLPHTREETLRLASRVSADDAMVALGFNASREAFLGLFVDRFRILHVATHAVLDPLTPDLSGIVLSLVDEAGKPRPGFVRAYEIRRASLPFELVNLSACATGMGRQTPGEGLLTLSRAFLDAGARRVVSSLWEVDDRATARLMIHFYEQYLDHRATAPQALRRAQLAMIADSGSIPGDWAPFIVQGDWRPADPRAAQR